MSNFITKKYINKILDEACLKLGYPKPKVIFMRERTFLEIFKDTIVVQEIIKRGGFNNYYEEYPNFTGMLGDSIVISLKRAKKLLKGFPEYKVREYMKYVIGHELCHIYNNHTGTLDEEGIACDEGAKITNMEIYNEVRDHVWGPLIKRLREIIENSPTSTS